MSGLGDKVGTSLNIYSLLGFVEAIVDGSDSDVTGFAIDTTNGSGFLHKHRPFRLDDGDGNINTAPAAGLYLLGMTLSAAGQETSDPFWFVLDAGLEDEVAHEAAVEWVESNIVPEPASIALLGIGSLLVLSRGRRRA